MQSSSTLWRESTSRWTHSDQTRSLPLMRTALSTLRHWSTTVSATSDKLSFRIGFVLIRLNNTFVLHWPPGCRPLMLPPSHEVGSAWASLSLAGSRETHSPSRASKTYGHNAFQIIHICTTVVNSGRTHCGLWLRLQSWLMPQSPPTSSKWPKMCRVRR